MDKQVEIAKLIGKPFKCAAHLSCPRRIIDLIRSQPGYSRQRRSYKIDRTEKGGIRLYALINGVWMDASSNNMAGSEES